MRRYQWIRWRTFLLRLAALVILGVLLWAGGPTYWDIALSIVGVILQLLFAILFVIIQFVALFWFLARGRTYWILPGETGTNWDDYRGNPEIVDNAKRIVTLLKGVKEFKEMGGEAIRGLLLCGPPGTGKSYLAQVIANEAQVPFAYASAPSFQNMFFGVGNLKVMSLYKKARKLAKVYGACIIFIDEIDAIGMNRQGAAVPEPSSAWEWAGNRPAQRACCFRWTRRISITRGLPSFSVRWVSVARRPSGSRC
ncbi:AAA family ATPase [Paenibacillus sp. P25]|nr:AAA family ATPase [Paenibacillus sp. P25]